MLMVRFFSVNLTLRYILKTARDYGMNFSKRSLVPKKRALAKFQKNKLKLRKFNPVVTVRET